MSMATEEGFGLYCTAAEVQGLKDSELLRLLVLHIDGLGEEPKQMGWTDRLLRLCRARYTGQPLARTVLKSNLTLAQVRNRYGNALLAEVEKQKTPWLVLRTKDVLLAGTVHDELAKPHSLEEKRRAGPR